MEAPGGGETPPLLLLETLESPPLPQLPPLLGVFMLDERLERGVDDMDDDDDDDIPADE